METVAVDWCDHLLSSLWAQVGATGATTTASAPALRIAVAWHEAEVRDWLLGQGLAVSRQSLAGYAAVLLAAAQRCGRRLPTDPDTYDWDHAEWYLVRLVALCLMSRDPLISRQAWPRQP